MLLDHHRVLQGLERLANPKLAHHHRRRQPRDEAVMVMGDVVFWYRRLVDLVIGLENVVVFELEVVVTLLSWLPRGRDWQVFWGDLVFELEVEVVVSLVSWRGEEDWQLFLRQRRRQRRPSSPLVHGVSSTLDRKRHGQFYPPGPIGIFYCLPSAELAPTK